MSSAATADPATDSVADGGALFQAKCALCHVGFAPGSTMLARRLGKDRALIAERTDLTADYVRQVVRSGINNMPPITRAEVADGELDAIVAYLTRPAAVRSAEHAPPARK
jgi:cytochrome c5